MAQYARPSSDITIGPWTTSPLYSKINEVTPDDGTLIQVYGDMGYCEVKLSGVTDPQIGTGHVLRWRYNPSGAGAAERINRIIMQGSTVIAADAYVSGTRETWNAASYTLTEAEANTITDYSDLRIRFYSSNLGATETMRISWAELETPDAPVQIDQPNFRVRSDDGQDLNIDAGWAGNLNQNVSMAAEKPFRIRFEVATSGSVTSAYKAQYRKNSGSWTDLTAPGFPAATATPTVAFYPSARYADGAATTNILAGSGLGFVTGSGETVNDTPSIVLNNQHTEIEICAMIRRLYDGESINNAGDTFEFRFVKSDGSVFSGTYVIPVITLTIPIGLIGGAYPETPNRIGPFKDGNGNLYQLVEHAETNPLAAMMKSTDGGDSWSRIDAANNPVTGDFESLDAILINDRIYLFHQASDAAVLHVFRVSTAASSPDTWELIDENVDTAAVATEQCAAGERRSNGDLIMFYVDANGAYDALYYRIKPNAGAWGSELALETEASIHWCAVACVMGANNIIYIIYAGQNGYCYYRTLNASDVLSGRIQLATGVGSNSVEDRVPVIPPVYYDASGTEKIFFFYKKNADDKLYCRILSGGSLGGESAAITDNAVLGNGALGRSPTAIANADGTTIHLLYADLATRDMWHDKNINEGGWGTDDEFVNNVTCDLISATIFTHSAPNGGQKVIGYTWAAGTDGYTGDVWYGEYALAAGPQTISNVGNIASGEIFGTPILTTGAVNVLPSAIASGEVFGTPIITTVQIISNVGNVVSGEAVGNPILYAIQTISNIGNIASTEAFGSPILTTGAVNVLPSSIISGEAFGNPTVSQPGAGRRAWVSWAEFEAPYSVVSDIYPSGIPSSETFGTPVVLRGAVNILPVGIASSEALGIPGVYAVQTISNAGGIISGEALGSPVVLPGKVIVSPTGIPSTEAVGNPTLYAIQTISNVGGIASAENFGTPVITTGKVILYPAGIASEETFGNLVVSVGAVNIIPSGIGSGEAFGTPNVSTGGGPQSIFPVGISSGEAFGNATFLPGIVNILPAGIPSPDVYGNPKINLNIQQLVGIVSQQAMGIPWVISGGAILVPGIESEEAFGQLELTVGMVNVLPGGIASGEIFGSTRVVYVIQPVGIGSGEASGTPVLVVGLVYILPTGIGSGEIVNAPGLISGPPVLYIFNDVNLRLIYEDDNNLIVEMSEVHNITQQVVSSHNILQNTEDETYLTWRIEGVM